jgi:hypothetical protein
MKDNNPILKTSFVTADALYEMVYDHESDTTSFCKQSKDGELETRLEKIEYGGKTYVPMPPDYALVQKKIICFSSDVTPYGSEEQLLEEISAFIHKYLDVSDIFEQIATYYVLFTWLYDRFNEVPYLRALGDFGSGKSRFLQTIGLLCYKPVFMGGATTASPMFRIIDEVKGTLVMDEADFKYSDMSNDIVKILNTGYQKGIPLFRSEGKGVFEVKSYDVFCPKIVATRDTFADKALESRFLIEEMGTSSLRADIPRTLDDNFYNEAELIRNKLLMWRLKNYFEPIERCSEIIEGIHPRLNQIVMPLLSIIKSEDVREHLKTFIVKYNGELTADRGLSWESDIVFSILKLEYEVKSSNVTTKQITDEVNKQSDIGEDTLQPRKVGWYLRSRLLLKPYKTRKGFVLDFDENRKRLNMWKERFGITDSEIRGEEVNNVTVVNVVEDADAVMAETAQELGL